MFDVLYAVGMAIVFAANTWLVYFKYRQCLKRVEDGESPAVLRQCFADLTFDAMIAIGIAILFGTSIGSVAGELKWTKAGLLLFVFGFICLLSVRPLRQLLGSPPEKQ
jgi:hypothetical protein